MAENTTTEATEATETKQRLSRPLRPEFRGQGSKTDVELVFAIYPDRINKDQTKAYPDVFLHPQSKQAENQRQLALARRSQGIRESDGKEIYTESLTVATPDLNEVVRVAQESGKVEPILGRDGKPTGGSYYAVRMSVGGGKHDAPVPAEMDVNRKEWLPKSQNVAMPRFDKEILPSELELAPIEKDGKKLDVGSQRFELERENSAAFKLEAAEKQRQNTPAWLPQEGAPEAPEAAEAEAPATKRKAPARKAKAVEEKAVENDGPDLG